MADTETTTRTQSEGATPTPTPTPARARTGAGAADVAAAKGAASPARLLRRMYGRGWYADAPLSAGGLYVFGALAPLLMLTAYTYVLRNVEPSFKGHVSQVWQVSLGRPHPWSAAATVDGVLGVTFMNLWIAFREKDVMRTVAWCIVNYLTGSLSTRCGAHRTRCCGMRSAAAASMRGIASQSCGCAYAADARPLAPVLPHTARAQHLRTAGARAGARRLVALLDGAARVPARGRRAQEAGVTRNGLLAAAPERPDDACIALNAPCLRDRLRME
jgi:hypothetical protein